MFDPGERTYLEAARVARLATADAEGRPHAVPVCFAFVGDHIVTPIDEKPKAVSPGKLRRSRDVDANPRVALVADHYTEDWSRLGWVQVRGTATLLSSGESGHPAAVTALREKYDQYADHTLEERPIIRISPGSVRSWGVLEPPDETGDRREAGGAPDGPGSP
jgi:PPOX class probable F420-dependent enzyme